MKNKKVDIFRIIFKLATIIIIFYDFMTILDLPSGNFLSEGVMPDKNVQRNLLMVITPIYITYFIASIFIEAYRKEIKKLSIFSIVILNFVNFINLCIWELVRHGGAFMWILILAFPFIVLFVVLLLYILSRVLRLIFNKKNKE